MSTATARTRATLRAQTPAQQAAIQVAMGTACAERARGGEVARGLGGAVVLLAHFKSQTRAGMGHLCLAVHPLETGSTERFGAPVSEAAARPKPRWRWRCPACCTSPPRPRDARPFVRMRPPRRGVGVDGRAQAVLVKLDADHLVRPERGAPPAARGVRRRRSLDVRRCTRARLLLRDIASAAGTGSCALFRRSISKCPTVE
jgi:hypothetical protein